MFTSHFRIFTVLLLQSVLYTTKWNSGDHIKEDVKTNKEFSMFSQQYFSGFQGYKAALFGVRFPKFVLKLWEPHTQADFSPTDLYVNRNHGNLYPFSVHVVTFTFHYQLMHLLIKNTFTVHI